MAHKMIMGNTEFVNGCEEHLCAVRQRRVTGATVCPVPLCGDGTSSD
jgi:hypothetical protein